MLKEVPTRAFLQSRKSERKHEAWLQSNHPQRLIVSFIGEASADGIATLKTRKFRWNAFRQEWYGFGKKEELQTLLAKDNVEITEVTK